MAFAATRHQITCQVKMRDRIPRMADLTMRPFISGKKTTGTLEAHTNGLRFTSKKQVLLTSCRQH